MTPELLRVKPVNVQSRYKATFFPPNYNLVKTEVSIALAGSLAEVFNLKSSNIIFNQNTMSTQYLSFRYVLPNEPIRYLDGLIGVDQAEVVFLNPASVLELKDEFMKVWKAVIEKSKPSFLEHYVEATLHCTTEGFSAKEFLEKFVNVRTETIDVQKGFSLTVKHPEIFGEAKIGLEVSTAIPEGLYVVFGCVSKKKINDTGSLGNLIDTTISIYKKLQPLAHIEIVEAM